MLEAKHSEEVSVLHCDQELSYGDSGKRLFKQMEIDFLNYCIENNESQISHHVLAAT